MMMETSDVFMTPQMDPGEQESFAFLRHALFDYKEDRKGDTLYITGHIGKQETIGEVGQQIFDTFENDEHTVIHDGGDGRLSILFDEPVDNGLRCIEITILQARE